jgi:uncharacterized protein YybS (DUF2232 family)
MRIKDVSVCVGGALFLLIGSAWIPFFGPFLSLLTPLPFLYFSSKFNLLQGLKLVGLAAVLMGLAAKFLGGSQVILLCLEFGLLGVILAELFRRQLTIGYTLLVGTFTGILLGFLFLYFVALSKNMGPMEMLQSYLKANLNETLKAYESMGAGMENAAELEHYGKALIEAIAKIYPALLILGTGFVVWLNVMLSRPLFRAGNLDYPAFVSLDRWRAPERMVWGVIAAGFALFLLSGSIELMAVNALIVFMAVYLLHGLSILLFFLNKYRVPAFIRFGLFFLIVFQQILLPVLALAGLFDQWIDFRKIQRRMGS